MENKAEGLQSFVLLAGVLGLGSGEDFLHDMVEISLTQKPKHLLLLTLNPLLQVLKLPLYFQVDGQFQLVG